MIRRHYRNALLFAAALPVLGSYDFARPIPNPVTEVSEVVSDVAADIAVNARAGKHLGFDTYVYPGDEAMRAWKGEDIGYEWVGYYLPSPCHRGTSWSGKRERLAQMGWGLAVIYVGQQVWDVPTRKKVVRTKYVTKRVKQTTRRKGKRVVRYVRKRVPVRTVTWVAIPQGKNCSNRLVTAARGTQDADDAVKRAEGEGFPHGTLIFLDIERMERVPEKMRSYYRAWTTRLLQDGRYRPGFYAHKHNAELIYRDVANVFLDFGRLDSPQFWIAGGKGFSEDKQPHEVGHSFASVWQGMLDVVREHNGVRLPIDVNVSSVPSPSTTNPAPVD